jgi:hypothetical protein
VSVIFDAALPATDAQTHALVIGVGEYPFLVGGLAPGATTMGLGQLTSSVKSAEAFAYWLTAKFTNSSAPLGSVELLLSPNAYAPAGQPPQAVERATLDNIKLAFKRWYDKCHANDDNVALFFFSGHGLEKEFQLLLAEDFADPATGNIWERAINFTQSWYGMGECKAVRQCYFIDACRETPIDLLKTSNANAYVLKSKAHGPANGVSYFTQALLDCLDGVGAEYNDGNCWKVTTTSLTDAVVRMVKRRQPASAPRLTCARGGESSFSTELHEFTDTPLVMAQITCQPLVAMGDATLSLSNTTFNKSRPPDATPWELDVASGQYDVEASFAGAQYQNKRTPGALLMPPFTPVVLKV